MGPDQCKRSGNRRSAVSSPSSLSKLLDRILFRFVFRPFSTIQRPDATLSENYGLRQRVHSLQLPERSTHLSDCNFLMRMLYTNSY